jgi:hypothetical protein
MSSASDPRPLNSHHQRTLEQIFQHPVSHNIEWPAVLSLLEGIGSVKESHDGKYVVNLGSGPETIERPRNKDIDTQLVVDLRHLLANAGYGPQDTHNEGGA